MVNAPSTTVARPRRFRKTRIVWSVSWWFVCVSLLIGWIVSAYWVTETVAKLSSATFVNIQVRPGTVLLATAKPTSEAPWTLKTRSVAQEYRSDLTAQLRPVRGSFGIGSSILVLPFWLLILIGIWAGVAPWLDWSARFSFRNFFVVTALVAVVLGIMVFAVR